MEKRLEKSLIAINENSIFYKIKNFFLKLFYRNESNENRPQIHHIEPNKIQNNSNQKESFIESIRNIENDETKLLKLQKQFDNYEIEKSELSKEQIADLTELYKKQINDLEKSNTERINRIKQHKDGELILQSIKIN